MKRALELASFGLGKVSPNPMVGCVIVKDGKIIGEGWHREFGGPHAEVNAVGSVRDHDNIRGSDVYVNLEPCAHHGKTPPCADLLTAQQVRRVFIANKDTFIRVNGKGIEKLRLAGIEVIENILEEKASFLNRRFFTYHNQNRPYIILKWAQTSDRFMARENYESKWISNEYSRQIVHKWRSEEDAIMVAANTVVQDDPQLNIRDWDGENPVRIVIDPDLKIPGTARVFDHSQRTIVYNYTNNQPDGSVKFIKLSEDKFLSNVFQHLKSLEIQSVIVEGGKLLLDSLFREGLWDEARVFISPRTFGKGIRSPEIVDAELIKKDQVFDDDLLIFKKRKID